MGYLPDLSECLTCGLALNGSRAYFHALADGLVCPEHKRLASSEMSADSRKLAAQMLRVPLSKLTAPDVASSAASGSAKSPAADLRKFLLQTLERHIEKKLATRGMLERLGN
jgi:DNA repair protein RecO (recombination protein O)